MFTCTKSKGKQRHNMQPFSVFHSKWRPHSSELCTNSFTQRHKNNSGTLNIFCTVKVKHKRCIFASVPNSDCMEKCEKELDWWGMRFSHQCWWRLQSSGIWCHIYNDLEELADFIFSRDPLIFWKCRCHHTKFSHLSDLLPRSSAPLIFRISTQCHISKDWNFQNSYSFLI